MTDSPIDHLGTGMPGTSPAHDLDLGEHHRRDVAVLVTLESLHRDLVRDKGFVKGGVNIHYLEKKLGMDKH